MITSFPQYLRLFLKGMAMGAADVVPGVSGGTIAFISGVYEELIDSLRKIDWTALQVLLRQGIKAAWLHINGNFLLTLFSGVILSAITLANIVVYCLEHYPVLIWAFFFGLVLASSLYLARHLERWTWVEVVTLIVGIAAAWSVSELKPAQLSNDWWVILLAGSVAICAMILPGVSGSFILLMMGLYTTVIEGLLSFDVVLIVTFGSGCVIGLLSFSHLLSWLLHRFHSATLATMTGFLLGSLNEIWPWKHVLVSTLDRHGETVALVRENVLPQQYLSLTGQDPTLTLALLAALIGAVLVLTLELSAKTSQAVKPKTARS